MRDEYDFANAEVGKYAGKRIVPAPQTLSWFGAVAKAPVNGQPQVDTPVGATCIECDEPIQAGDDGFIDVGGYVHHRLCLLNALGLK